MERDDIIRLAREAGAGEPQSLYGRTDYIVMTAHDLERFAALVAAHEREACAKLCDDWLHADGNDCAEAIRARGKEPKRHPGYIIGDHWLQAAYTRICTGETEDEVMTDYGWQRARGEK